MTMRGANFLKIVKIFFRCCREHRRRLTARFATARCRTVFAAVCREIKKKHVFCSVKRMLRAFACGMRDDFASKNQIFDAPWSRGRASLSNSHERQISEDLGCRIFGNL